MADIRSGMSVDVIFEGDEKKSQIPHLQTMISSITGQRIALSQTAPPVTMERKGKRLLVTFLETNEGVSVRHGFWAKLQAFAVHEISPSQSIPVLIIERETEPKKHDLRMHYRIKPLMNSGITVSFQGAPVTIVDISVGGLRISAKNAFSFEVHDTITITLGIDDMKFKIEGKVVKSWHPLSTGAGGRLYYATIQFLTNLSVRESLLSKKIIILERELLAQGLT